MAQFHENIELKSGAYVKNLMASTSVDADIMGVIKNVLNDQQTTVEDVQFYDGASWVSLRGYKSTNTTPEEDGLVKLLEGLEGNSYKFRVLKAGKSAEEFMNITQSNGVITIDLNEAFKTRIATIETALGNRVVKVEGKDLSSNDFTTALKHKLESIRTISTGTIGEYRLEYTEDLVSDVNAVWKPISTISFPIESVIESGEVLVFSSVTPQPEGTVPFPAETVPPRNPPLLADTKYLVLKLAGGDNYIYINAADLISEYSGFTGTHIKTTIASGVIKGELNVASLDISEDVALNILKPFLINKIITPSSTTIAEETPVTLISAIRTFATNIRHLQANKANKIQTIGTITPSSTQTVAGDIDITLVIQKLISNIAYLFTGKAETIHTHNEFLKPSDVIDNITSTDTTKPLSANQGRDLGVKINERLKGITLQNGASETPLLIPASKIATIPQMTGATTFAKGKSGLVPEPLANQQDMFLTGKGDFRLPNADIVASASYMGTGAMVGANFETTAGDVTITLPAGTTYASKSAFPMAVDIVKVMRNGLDLIEMPYDESLATYGEGDFKITHTGGNVITLVDYPLNSDDVIMVRYKTSIGIYGSVFQETIDNAILITNDANTAAQRAEEAAIDAETIADSKVDKTSITQDLGDSETDVMSQKATTDELDTKANHGYESSPKTLKEVEDNTSVKIKNLVVNGDFRNGTTGWEVNIGASLSVVDGVATYLPSQDGTQYLLKLMDIKKGSIYYSSISINATTQVLFSFGTGASFASERTITQLSYNTQGVMSRTSAITSLGDTTDATNLLVREATAYSFKNVMYINLTEIFGVGNEPTREEFELLLSTLGIDYFEGEIVIPAQKVMQWQLKLIRINKNAIIAFGGTII